MAKKVFVGLSGGVDSAVSAALLKREGFDVTGVFIKIWRPTFFECTWERDRLDAMRVAVALDIPFREIDLSDEYEREVIYDMTTSYSSGSTPNPDISCNEKIKFGAFYDWARREGADFVATGHYARITHEDGRAQLMRGVDTQKDQSYFLYRINAEHLQHVMFPVGKYLKEQVRDLAREFTLPVAHKHDSQGLCFVGDVSMSDFLSRYIAVERGAVLDVSGKRIGEHRGAALYTIGQRHGFTTDGADVPDVPHYVTKIDAAKNTLTVSPDISDAMRVSVELVDQHWLSEIREATRYSAQSRYRERSFAITIRSDSGRMYADFDEPHVVSPGQSLVLYNGSRCLGGAKIC